MPKREITRAYCCVHLLRNLVTNYGKTTESFFWPIARATSAEEFRDALEALRKEKPAAADYLADIPHHLWVTAYFPTTRYGYVSSNIVEVMNAAYLQERKLPILTLLNEI